MPTREDVARLAGVSGSTVSRVFNNPQLVAPEARDRVLRASAELDYHPNLMASNFVRGRSGNLGVVVPYIPEVHLFSSYYFAELLSGIGDAAIEQGYDLVLIYHRSDGGANDYRRYFTSGKVDACILLGTTLDDPFLPNLVESTADFCLVNNYFPHPQLNYVDIDNVSGAIMATEHLVQLGHRRIALLNGPDNMVNSRDRQTGYLETLQRHSIPLRDEWLLHGNYGRRSGYAAATVISSMVHQPTAVFCSNDRMASGLIQGLRDLGLRIPEDISVVGYDDADVARHVEPQLTTVRVPMFDLGKIDSESLLKKITAEIPVPFQVRLIPTLVVRDSSAPPPTDLTFSSE